MTLIVRLRRYIEDLKVATNRMTFTHEKWFCIPSFLTYPKAQRLKLETREYRMTKVKMTNRKNYINLWVTNH